MRQDNEIEVLKLPLHIRVQESAEGEAGFFALEWMKARTPERREAVIRGLMENGGVWDIITRSLVYYPEFERQTGQHFPGLWR